VDHGSWDGLPDATYPEPETSRAEALHRVIKHRNNIIRVNPADDRLVDEALRCALTCLMTNEACMPPPGSDLALRYLRDRINVPRDMSIYAAKRLRQALENCCPSGRSPESAYPLSIDETRTRLTLPGIRSTSVTNLGYIWIKVRKNSMYPLMMSSLSWVEYQERIQQQTIVLFPVAR
jgi:hypothetical protein